MLSENERSTRLQQILLLRLQKYSLRAIGERLGLSRETIRQELKKLEETPVNPAKFFRCVQLYHTPYNIGVKLGITTKRVKELMEEYGITPSQRILNLYHRNYRFKYEIVDEISAKTKFSKRTVSKVLADHNLLVRGDL